VSKVIQSNNVEIVLDGVPVRGPVGYVPAPVDAAELAERLSKLNRKQRRGIIARAKKAARAAKKGKGQ
jgi:glycosyltransferase involved in cell wall biosynthesis